MSAMLRIALPRTSYHGTDTTQDTQYFDHCQIIMLLITVTNMLKGICVFVYYHRINVLTPLVTNAHTLFNSLLYLLGQAVSKECG